MIVFAFNFANEIQLQNFKQVLVSEDVGSNPTAAIGRGKFFPSERRPTFTEGGRGGEGEMDIGDETTQQSENTLEEAEHVHEQHSAATTPRRPAPRDDASVDSSALRTNGVEEVLEGSAYPGTFPEDVVAMAKILRSSGVSDCEPAVVRRSTVPSL